MTGKKNSRSAYLLYDADCGPCTSFMKVAQRLDYKREIIPVALENPFSQDLVGDRLSREEMSRSFHLVRLNADGKQVFSAGDGLIHLIEYFPLGNFASPLSRIRAFRKFMSWSYLQATRLRKSSCSLDQP